MAAIKDVSHIDLHHLLCSDDRDYLINNSDAEFEIEILKGKTIGFYFSAAWSGPCKRFTPFLIDAFNEIVSATHEFEVVFVSADDDEESFEENFSKMPMEWMAIPFFDSETRARLDEVFEVRGLPHLAILDESGKLVLNDMGVEILREYGAEAFPFEPEKIQSLKHGDEAAAMAIPSLTSIFLSPSLHYAVSSNGGEVPVSDLQGKTVGIYFSMFSFKPSMDFTNKLVQVYNHLKSEGQSFEIVMIPLDEEEEDDEDSFNQTFQTIIPWLSLPLNHRSCQKLVRFFELSRLPTLVIFGEDGKLLHPNVKEAIEEHGALAYPFTPQRFDELDDLVTERERSQTLESILVSGNQDFVIDKDGAKIPAATLVGKNILLLFSAHWSSPCRTFMAKLIEAYRNIKEKDDAMEVIFISSDKNESSFTSFFSTMPWLALPFKDSRILPLKRIFKIVPGIPIVVAIGASGRTVTRNAENLIKLYGAEAYPFTGERLNEMVMEMGRRLPGKVKNGLHEEHELVLARREVYTCDGCSENGYLLSFCCIECNFDLHLNCALG